MRVMIAMYLCGMKNFSLHKINMGDEILEDITVVLLLFFFFYFIHLVSTDAFRPF